MNTVTDVRERDRKDDSVLALHISQVPENVGLIRIVKDLANPGREVLTDGSWSKGEIDRLRREYPQLIVELQVNPEEKLNVLVEQFATLTKRKFVLERMFEDVEAVQARLKERVKEVFDDQIISFRNKMTLISYGINEDSLIENAAAYKNLISYSTHCFLLGMLFAEYIGELSDQQRIVLGKSLILHKIGYIETMNDSASLLERTIAILELGGYEKPIIQFAKNQGRTRYSNKKLKNLLRTTEIGKIVTYYCNCTVNYPKENPPDRTIARLEEILAATGLRREMLFEPTLLTKFVQMIRRGLEMQQTIH